MAHSAPGPASRLPRPGERFANRYDILAEVGSGGMSAVYKARDTLANETLALKVIQPEVAEKPKLLEKFKLELSLARRMAHPNVVRIHDLGDAGALFYISMEFIDGETVADRLARQGPYSLADFWPVMRQFCDALGYIHSRQVVHRDIKPLNLMVDRTGTVKLMDFGISRDLATDRTVGVLMGTPAYMAPEVMAGQPATPRSDLYSAGVLFYEMLTGHKPMPGRAEPLPEDVPPALERTIRRCLEIDPARRPASVLEVIASVELPPEPPKPVAAGTFEALVADQPGELDVVMPHFVRLLELLRERRAQRMMLAPLAPCNIRIQQDRVEVEALAADGSTDGAEMGEPKYTAPEAFHAGPVEVETADIYVVGFLLYECLLGRTLFAAEFAGVLRAGGDLAWLNWHGDEGRRARPLAEVLTTWPAHLSKTLARMMEKRPADRVRTYDEALVELKKVWQPGTVVLDETPTPPPPIPPEKDGGRKPVPWVWMVVSAALAVICGIGLWWWQIGPRTKVNEVRRQTAEVKEVPPPPPPPPPEQIETPTGLMRLVPAGSFLMGTARGRLDDQTRVELEAPPVAVEVPAFYLDRLEVSNAEYLKFCAATGRPRPTKTNWPDYLNNPALPVIGVTWHDAREFCEWAGKRLPSEAEWEKAARGTDNRQFPWGDEPDPKRAKWAENTLDKWPAPVGSHPGDCSPYGVLDLSGNVPEWVEDAFRLYPGNPGVIPEAEIRGKKVVRGGGAFLPGLLGETRVKSGYGRVTNRDLNAPEGASSGGVLPIGFRCAANLESATKFQLKR